MGALDTLLKYGRLVKGPDRVMHGSPKPWVGEAFKPTDKALTRGWVGDVIGPHATENPKLADAFARGLSARYYDEIPSVAPEGSSIRFYKPKTVLDVSDYDKAGIYGDADILNEVLLSAIGRDNKVPIEKASDMRRVVKEAQRAMKDAGVDALRYRNTGLEVPMALGSRNVTENSYLVMPWVENKFAGGGLASIARKSLSNPAWFKANAAKKAMTAQTPSELSQSGRILELIRRLDSHTEPVDPETYFLLQKSMDKSPVPPLRAIQEELPGFAGGGLAQFRPLKRDAGKNLSPKQDISVMDDPENLAPRMPEREEPLGAVDILDVVPWGPGRIGRMLGGLSALTASNPAEAGVREKLVNLFMKDYSPEVIRRWESGNPRLKGLYSGKYDPISKITSDQPALYHGQSVGAPWLYPDFENYIVHLSDSPRTAVQYALGKHHTPSPEGIVHRFDMIKPPVEFDIRGMNTDPALIWAEQGRGGFEAIYEKLRDSGAAKFLREYGPEWVVTSPGHLIRKAHGGLARYKECNCGRS